MPHTFLPYWVAALFLRGIGPRRFLRWLSCFQQIELFFSASVHDLKAVGMGEKEIQALKNPDWHAVEKELAWGQKTNQHLICMTDEDYPSQLKEIDDPPLVLYVRGNKNILSAPQLAIVGSRRATQAGLQHAKQFAHHLSEAGLVITSGLAQGIDAASHEGALTAKKLTIGVAGTGLSHTYPSQHRQLVEDILALQGAVVSEFPLAMPPHAMNFPRRNRIIAGLSLGVLVVEAALKSGSLITASCALQYNREVFAIPGSIHSPQAKGCHFLIQQGAKLVETSADVLLELQPRGASFSAYKPALAAAKIQTAPLLSVEERQIFDQIHYEITPLDMIIWRSGLTAAEVSSILLRLELEGYIQSAPGGYIRMALNQ